MNTKNRKQFKIQTLLNHPQRVVPVEGNLPLISPIYQTSKFVIDPEKSLTNQFIYTRISNPSLTQLERLLSEIQNKEDTIVFSSGVAAITNFFLSYLKMGDHIISFNELYKPARIFIRDHLPNFGINSTIIDLNDLEALKNAIIPGKTKLIHFESLTNPNLDVADIQKIIEIAHSHGIKVSVDGTFAGIHQHSQFDIDFIIHSLTKYANGHGDILAGSISGTENDISNIRSMTIFLGATLDPHSAFLIERGLKTYKMRYLAHSASAQKIAEFLESHPKIEKVFYPGLKSHPHHERAKNIFKEMGGVVSFILKDCSANEFCNKLGLIQCSVSVGSTESIIAPTEFFFASDLASSQRMKMGMTPNSLRLSVGLEDPEDLINDLGQALS